MTDTIWRIMIDYKLADYPNCEPDDELDEIISNTYGGSRTGFGHRDMDASFDTEEEAMEAYRKLENLVDSKYEHIEYHWLEVFACCHNPADDDCICA